MTREELIEAGARASAAYWHDPFDVEPDQLDRESTTAILDAVGPLITAYLHDEVMKLRAVHGPGYAGSEHPVHSVFRCSRCDALAEVLTVIDGTNR